MLEGGIDYLRPRSTLNHWENLTEVSSQCNHLTSKWHVRVHDVPESPVQYLQQVTMSHWRFIPNNYLGLVNELCQITLGRDGQGRMLMYLDGSLEARVKGSAQEEGCSNAAGCYGQSNGVGGFLKGANSCKQGVECESLSCTPAGINECR